MKYRVEDIHILVIIVTYNGMRWIEHTLDMVRASTYPLSVMVIDNNSTDETVQAIRTKYSEVRLVSNTENLGFGQANNIGLRYALKEGFDYAMLLNQDAYIEPEMVEKLLKQSDSIHLVTPLHMNCTGTDLDKGFCETLQNAGLSTEISQLKEPSYYVGDTCAACWLMPSSLIEKVGGFNPLFYHYGEDNNYYHRMKYHGFGEVILVPSARMCHDRILHGDMQAFQRGMVHREVLLVFCNINYSPSQWLKPILQILYGCYLKRKVRPYKMGAWFVEVIWSIANHKRILKSRQVERKIGAWL